MTNTKETTIKFRCTEEEKKMLGDIAKMTSLSASEVLRKLILLGYQQSLAAMANQAYEEGAVNEPVELSLNVGNAYEKFFIILGKLYDILANAGREDLASDMLHTLLEQFFGPVVGNPSKTYEAILNEMEKTRN